MLEDYQTQDMSMSDPVVAASTMRGAGGCTVTWSAYVNASASCERGLLIQGGLLADCQ
jgi:hypothetical protein